MRTSSQTSAPGVDEETMKLLLRQRHPSSRRFVKKTSSTLTKQIGHISSEDMVVSSHSLTSGSFCDDGVVQLDTPSASESRNKLRFFFRNQEAPAPRHSVFDNITYKHEPALECPTEVVCVQALPNEAPRVSSLIDEEAMSLGNETAVSALTTDDTSPDTAILQSLLAQLTPAELEAAACTSYGYAKSSLATPADQRTAALNARRERAAMAMMRRHYKDHHQQPGPTVKSVKASVAEFEKRHGTLIRESFLAEKDGDPIQADFRRIIRFWTGPAGRVFVRGFDHEGRACLHAILKNSPECTKKDSSTGCVESCFFHIEKALACSENLGASEAMVACVDFDGFKVWHSPPPSILIELLSLETNHYPGRVYRYYLLDAPLAFRAIWSLVKPFVAEKTKSKILFVTGPERRHAIMTAAFDADQAMPYQRPDGQLTEPVDMEAYYRLPFDEAYN